MTSTETTQDDLDGGSQRSGIVDRFIDLDRWFQGRRLKVLSTLAIAQVLVAPMLDRVLGTFNQVRSLSRVSRQFASAEYANMSLVSALFAGALLLSVAGIVAGRLAAVFGAEDDGSDPDDKRTKTSKTKVGDKEPSAPISDRIGATWIVAKLYAQMGMDYFRGKSPWPLLAAAVGLEALRSAFTVMRFVLWNQFIERFDREDGLIAKGLVWVWATEGVLIVATLCFIVAFLYRLWSSWGEIAESHQAGNGDYTAKASPKILERLTLVALQTNSAELKAFKRAYPSSRMNRLVETIRRWTPPRHANESACQASLLLELRRSGFGVSNEYHLGGRRRIDLLVDHAVGIEMKVRLTGKSPGDRAKSQVRQYAQLCTRNGFHGPVFGLFGKPSANPGGRLRARPATCPPCPRPPILRRPYSASRCWAAL